MAYRAAFPMAPIRPGSETIASMEEGSAAVASATMTAPVLPSTVRTMIFQVLVKFPGTVS